MYRKKILPIFYHYRLLLIPTLIVIFIVIAGFIIFRHIGVWLLVADPPPRKLDAICTFAGESVRVKYSKSLAVSYPEAKWFLSDYTNGHGRILERDNFNMSRVFIVDTCKSTISEVQAIAEWITTLHNDNNSGNHTENLNIGLVSSPYHMRRISIMVSRWIRKKCVNIYYLPVPFSYYSWNRDSLQYWWRYDPMVSITTRELMKLGYFFLTGYF